MSSIGKVVVLEPSTTLKRELEEMADSYVSSTPETGTSATGAPFTSIEIQRAIKAEIVTASLMAACRVALVKSPAATRAALTKYKTSLDPAFAKVLEVIGGYKRKVIPVANKPETFLIYLVVDFMI